MRIQSTQNNDIFTLINQSTTPHQAQDGINEVEDRFLKLLITQMQNQDPLNPMQYPEITMQLAQMSTVEGITRLNAGVESLLASYRASQALLAANLIGHQVMVEGDRLLLTDSGEAIGGIRLTQGAQQVQVNIFDQSGELVRRLQLGALSAGLNRFSWDGKDDRGMPLPRGVYRFAVEAQRDGQPVGATALTSDEVNSVITEGRTIDVQLANRGRVSLDAISQIF